MAFIPFPACAEVVLTFRNNNNLNFAKNVFGIRSTAGNYSSAALADVNLALTGWMTNTLRSLVSTEMSLVDVYSRALHADNGPVQDTPITIAGTLASPLMPMNVTIALKLLTGLAGRSYRGRWYFCGLVESKVGGDFVDQTHVTNIIAALSTLRNTVLPAHSSELVILSRFHNKAPRAEGVATPVNNISVTDTRVDTQRRRLIGEGQ